MNINKNDINYEIIHNIYETKGYITVKNFLSKDYAEEFYDFLINLDPTWWYHSSIVNNDRVDIRNLADITTQQKIKSRREDALKSFSEAKNFSYSFYRTVNNHYETCECFLCKFTEKIIKNKVFLSFIEKVTGESNLKLETFFFTEYKSGDFLYPHTDSPNGKVAIVLHMTKNWKPWFGGNLCMLDKTHSKVRETLVPQFNSMTVMKIVEKINPHFVEYIPQNVKEHRFAMVCWFN